MIEALGAIRDGLLSPSAWLTKKAAWPVRPRRRRRAISASSQGWRLSTLPRRCALSGAGILSGERGLIGEADYLSSTDPTRGSSSPPRPLTRAAPSGVISQPL